MPELRRMQPLLGTFVEIGVDQDACGAGVDTASAVQAAFDAIDRVQSLMSFHDAESELSRINRNAHRRPVKVHRWTWRVLLAAHSLHRHSEGVFDPSVAGQLARDGLLPALDADRPDEAASFSDVSLHGGHVSFRRPLWLDLGGIAKGFAVDLAVLTLRARGVRQARVNAGGDLRVIGPHATPLHLRAPQQPTRTVLVGGLRNAACATSGNYFGQQPGAWCIRAPGTGVAPQSHSVTVLAPTCLLADALTKVVALKGPVDAEPVLQRFHARAYTGLLQ